MNSEIRTENAPTPNIVWHEGHVTSEDRERVLQQRGCVLWFTGLSGSGKSTIAAALEETLIGSGHAAYVLDGDNVRHGLNSDLDFSPESRKENIRRIGEVAALFADSGMITITAFISPYRDDRDRARTIVDAGLSAPLSSRFFEVYVNTPIEVCESRDPKKLYAKARAGEIANFTGISAPFEAPEQADIELHTDKEEIEACVASIISKLQADGILPNAAHT
jgi:adenylylsulfate kinase